MLFRRNMNTSFHRAFHRPLTLTALLLFTTHLIAGVPNGYYSKANGLKKEQLKQAMHEIVGQANVLNYGSGAGATWSGFYQTDRMENNQVRDRYSYEVSTSPPPPRPPRA